MIISSKNSMQIHTYTAMALRARALTQNVTETRTNQYKPHIQTRANTDADNDIVEIRNASQPMFSSLSLRLFHVPLIDDYWTIVCVRRLNVHVVFDSVFSLKTISLMFISCFLRVSVVPRKAHSELYRGRDTTCIYCITFSWIFRSFFTVFYEFTTVRFRSVF